MNIDIVISDQVGAVLRRKAASFGQNLNEYLQRVVAEVAEDEDDLPSPPKGESTEAYMARMRTMIQQHAVRCGHVDDSRESIYAGRGE